MFEGHFIVGAKTDGAVQWGYRSHLDSDTITNANLPPTYYIRQVRPEKPGTGPFDFVREVTNTKPTVGTDYYLLPGTDPNGPVAIKVVPSYVALHFCRRKP
jgi:hypothetical protein